jgi:hypothetical protein
MPPTTVTITVPTKLAQIIQGMIDHEVGFNHSLPVALNMFLGDPAMWGTPLVGFYVRLYQYLDVQQYRSLPRRELAEAMSMDEKEVGRTLEHMEECGYIERGRNEARGQHTYKLLMTPRAYWDRPRDPTPEKDG